MKRFLRSLLDFLERKFPDRVVVTTASYEALAALVRMHHIDIRELQHCRHENLVALEAKVALLETDTPDMKDLKEKIAKLESEINKFNVAMGFGPLTAKNVAAAVLER